VVAVVAFAVQPSGSDRPDLTFASLGLLQLVTSVVRVSGLPASVDGASGAIRMLAP
jgi:hypothetical protein